MRVSYGLETLEEESGFVGWRSAAEIPHYSYVLRGAMAKTLVFSTGLGGTIY